MRGLLAVLVVSWTFLVGCTVSSRAPGDPDDPFCDTSCSRGQVCTRSGDCLPPSQVREIHVNWLVSGQMPDEAACSPNPNLRIDVSTKDERDRVNYSPVPCIAGRYTIDKLPTTFDQVWLGPVRGSSGAATGQLDAGGELTLDLPF
jgi:hypothetical protein